MISTITANKLSLVLRLNYYKDYMNLKHNYSITSLDSPTSKSLNTRTHTHTLFPSLSLSHTHRHTETRQASKWHQKPQGSLSTLSVTIPSPHHAPAALHFIFLPLNAFQQTEWICHVLHQFLFTSLPTTRLPSSFLLLSVSSAAVHAEDEEAEEDGDSHQRDGGRRSEQLSVVETEIPDHG